MIPIINHASIEVVVAKFIIQIFNGNWTLDGVVEMECLFFFFIFKFVRGIFNYAEKAEGTLRIFPGLVTASRHFFHEYLARRMNAYD